jgi:hypothetical protein
VRTGGWQKGQVAGRVGGPSLALLWWSACPLTNAVSTTGNLRRLLPLEHKGLPPAQPI